jgi:hypothetical protein
MKAPTIGGRVALFLVSAYFLSHLYLFLPQALAISPGRFSDFMMGVYMAAHFPFGFVVHPVSADYSYADHLMMVIVCICNCFFIGYTFEWILQLARKKRHSPRTVLQQHPGGDVGTTHAPQG